MKPNLPFVTARSMIVTYYPKNDGDNAIFIVSSQGNEHLLEKHKAKIGDNVIATIVINYMIFSPKYDSCGDLCGTDCKQIFMSNANGDLINAMKEKMVAAQSNMLTLLSEYVRESK